MATIRIMVAFNDSLRRARCAVKTSNRTVSINDSGEEVMDLAQYHSEHKQAQARGMAVDWEKVSDTLIVGMTQIVKDKDVEIAKLQEPKCSSGSAGEPNPGEPE